jgi:hypothetical protein
MTHLTEQEFQSITKQDEDEPESILQKKITSWAREKGYPCLSFSQTSKVKRVLGHQAAGWPDITIALPTGLTLYLELKKKGGLLKEKQKLMAQMLIQLGHGYYVVKTWRRFEEIIRSL